MFKKKAGPGLKDIAEKAGLAIPTVSLILNGRSNNYISQKTRERVLAIASEMKYRPRFSGKLLTGQATRTAALVLTEPVHRSEPHLQELVLRLIEGLEGMGHAAYVATLTRDPVEQLTDLADRGCEAFLLIGCLEAAPPLEALFKSRDLAYVGYNSNLSRSVDSDTPFAVAALLRHFLARGRDEFHMFLLPEAEAFAPNSRQAALPLVFPHSKEMTAHKDRLIFMEQSGADAPSRVQAGHKATREALASGLRPQAILYHTDYHALGGVQALTEAGLVVGSDVLVAGYNHIEAVRWHPLPISSAAPDLDAVVSALLAALFKAGPCRQRIEPKRFLRER